MSHIRVWNGQEFPGVTILKLYVWNGSFLQSCKIRTWSGTDWV